MYLMVIKESKILHTVYNLLTFQPLSSAIEFYKYNIIMSHNKWHFKLKSKEVGENKHLNISATEQYCRAKLFFCKARWYSLVLYNDRAQISKASESS